MEQKQLDELDESYFGEEFVDEELLAKTSKEKNSKDEIKIEPIGAESKVKKRSYGKKTAKSAKMDTPLLESTKPTMKSESEAKGPASESVLGKPRVEIIDEPRTTTKETTKESSTNPFSSEKSSENKPEAGFNLKEVSTWKAITGVVIILLILSVFTQGFNFGENQVTGAVSSGKILSLEEAEWRVVRYINENLLEPPFMATVDSSKEFGSLYRLDLSIGDEKVVSYVTKDGRYFFPQGIDISFYVTVEEVPSKEKSLKAEDTTDTSATDVSDSASVKSVPDPETSSTPEAEVEVVNLNSPSVRMITAKKWLFSPHQIVVKQGEMVSLLIEPKNLDFTFAIPELGVEKAVSGPTTVEFKAEKKGSFPFSCSSCEEWRGMTGTLIVE